MATNEGARDFEALQKKFEPKRNELTSLNTEDREPEEAAQHAGRQDERGSPRHPGEVDREQAEEFCSAPAKMRRTTIEQQQNEIAQRILQKMAPVIDKYAKSNGYGLLFDSSNPWPQGPLLWATAGVDLTKAIVDAYNAQSGVAAPPRPAGAPPAAGRPVGTATPPAGAKPASATPALDWRHNLATMTVPSRKRGHLLFAWTHP